MRPATHTSTGLQDEHSRAIIIALAEDIWTDSADIDGQINNFHLPRNGSSWYRDLNIALTGGQIDNFNLLSEGNSRYRDWTNPVIWSDNSAGECELGEVLTFKRSLANASVPRAFTILRLVRVAVRTAVLVLGFH
jgi:hypothetical protein